MNKDFYNIDHFLSKEDIAFRNKIRSFVNADYIPIIADYYDIAKFPDQVIPKLAELGVLGATLPKEYGGLDLNPIQYGLVCQELERGDSGLRSFVSVQNSLFGHSILKFGSDEQKKFYLPKVVRGEISGCFCLTEPVAGSDPSSMQSFASVNANGDYVLNGHKIWITNGSNADYAIVYAKTDNGYRGFIVDTKTKGFEVKVMTHKLALRAKHTGEIILNNCIVPKDNVLPLTDVGLKAALKCLTEARFGISFGVLGAAMFSFEYALDYTLNRKQFNAPLASKQLVQYKLADMASAISVAMAFNYNVALTKSKGLANFPLVSMAKMQSCKAALEVCRTARDLLGANGVSGYYHVMRHACNLEAVYTYEGTDIIHHLIIAKELTGIESF